MSSTDTSLAASAFAIALVALIIAVGQLLQQYLATADGYRRCQRSVMGDWAKMTRLRWRWREFRLETRFTTPELYLSGDGAGTKEEQVFITGETKSREQTFLPASSFDNDVDAHIRTDASSEAATMTLLRRPFSWRPTKKQHQLNSGRNDSSHNPSDELACWLPLLDQIHRITYLSLSRVNFTKTSLSIPTLVFRERSWDFQPPDVVRPLAKTTVSDIAIISRRMGMRWKDFRPADGVLRAEGHSHIITSTVVRSLGLVLQYSHTGQVHRLWMVERSFGRLDVDDLHRERNEIYIPRAISDRLGYGIIRGQPELALREITVGTQQEIVVALRKLDRSGESAATLAKILRENPDFHFRIGDICALTLGMIRLRGSGLVQVPAPSDSVYGVTTSSHGRRAFRSCLEAYIQQHEQVGEQTRLVLKMYCDLSSTYPEWDKALNDFAELDEIWAVARNVDYLEKVHDIFDALTEYLRELHRKHIIRYIGLLGIHIRLCIFCPSGETTPLAAEIPRYTDDVERYFDQLPAISAAVRQFAALDEDQVVDAWVSMMLRAFCWGACHFLVPGERVPAAYYGSQLPVYIG
ncbi:hypothetical protein MMC17_004351 [Xylographa soralifera]|nr:hypothetical protein [Xylographa soralifera]